MRLYKLTNQDGTSRKDIQWGKGVTHFSLSEKPIPKPHAGSYFELLPKCWERHCREINGGAILAYENKNLAYLVCLLAENFSNPVLWQARGTVAFKSFGKVGCFELKTIKAINAPKWVGSKVDRFIRVQFAVLCAESVIDFYEKEWPEEKRPRLALEAAKDYLRNPFKKNYSVELESFYDTNDIGRTCYNKAPAALIAFAAALSDSLGYSYFVKDDAASAARAVELSSFASHTITSAKARDGNDIDLGKLADKAVSLWM